MIKGFRNMRKRFNQNVQVNNANIIDYTNRLNYSDSYKSDSSVITGFTPHIVNPDLIVLPPFVEGFNVYLPNTDNVNPVKKWVNSSSLSLSVTDGHRVSLNNICFVTQNDDSSLLGVDFRFGFLEQNFDGLNQRQFFGFRLARNSQGLPIIQFAVWKVDLSLNDIESSITVFWSFRVTVNIPFSLSLFCDIENFGTSAFVNNCFINKQTPVFNVPSVFTSFSLSRINFTDFGWKKLFFGESQWLCIKPKQSSYYNNSGVIGGGLL
jgi:hypothetical protein